MLISRSLLLKAAALLLALTSSATAQEFQTKPLRIIVPFPPGAFNDIAARLVHTNPELRLGVFTSLLGTPFFFWLVVRIRKVAP